MKESRFCRWSKPKGKVCESDVKLASASKDMAFDKPGLMYLAGQGVSASFGISVSARIRLQSLLAKMPSDWEGSNLNTYPHVLSDSLWRGT